MATRQRRFRFEKELAQTAVPVYVVDADRCIVFVNPACEALLGRSYDTVRGLLCGYREPTGTNELLDLGSSLAAPPEVYTGEPRSAATVIVTAAGDRIRRRIHFFPWFDHENQVAWVFAQISDRAELPDNESVPTHIALHDDTVRLRERLYRRFGFERIVGQTDMMRRVLEQVRLVCQCDVNVLLRGEPGTGRKLTSRTIHHQGTRRSGPFVPINCALVPADVLEYDLFGSDSHDETGPFRKREGVIARAVGGTLFLDNIAHLPRDLQKRLVTWCRHTDAEGPRRSPSAVRIIAADRTESLARSANAECRADLYCEIATLVIQLPPLRSRLADLPLLAQHFVEVQNGLNAKQLSGLAPAAIEVLQTYEWPGNVRELEEVVRESAGNCSSNLIRPEDLPARIQGALGGTFAPPPAPSPINLDQALELEERRLIESALRRARGNKSLAAHALGVSRPRLYRRMQQLGMTDGDSPERIDPSPRELE